MFSFPWSNFHELNLDWILSVVKEAKEIFVKGEGDIQHAVETADQALETAEQAAAGVIADGAVTIPKVNDEVFNLMAFIVSGSVNPVAIPAGSLVILRKSTVYNVSDGIYIAAGDIPASSILTAADLLQPSPLPDAGGLNYVMSVLGGEIDNNTTSINAIERGLVTVVDGDTATSAVPVGALAYVKNNTHDLQEGLHANISNAPFPTSGGTADSTVFSAVLNVLNSIRDVTGDGALINFTATNLTGAVNELKSDIDALESSVTGILPTIVPGTTTGSVSVPNNIGTVIGTITLTEGFWIILACCNWTGNAVGYRQLAFESDSVNPARNAASVLIPNGVGTEKEMYQQVIMLRYLSTPATIDIYARQTSGGDLTAYPYIYAIKI